MVTVERQPDVRLIRCMNGNCNTPLFKLRTLDSGELPVRGEVEIKCRRCGAFQTVVLR